LRLPTTLPPTVVQPAPASPAPTAPQPSPSAGASPTAGASPSPSPSPSVAVESAPQGAEGSSDTPSDEQVAASPNPAPRTQEDIQRDLLARQQELKALYTYNPAGTSVVDANTSFLSWYSQAMGKDYAEDAARPDQQVVTADYPKLACPLKQSRNAVVGVVVDANNQIMGEPTVLQSSGYQLFNREALNLAKAYGFENKTGEQQVYLLRVNFEYSEEVCPPGLEPLAPAG
jgi:outer membrane biosynthesis protein TonB